MRAQSESWLRGPIAGVHPMLMPAAHALLQTMADAEAATAGLSVEELWKLPGTAAPIGFHLKHLAASTDRLLTYARGERLNDAQKAALVDEKSPGTPASAQCRLDRARHHLSCGRALSAARGTNRHHRQAAARCLISAPRPAR